MLAACQAAPPNPCRLALATDIPLTPFQGHALTPALLNGKRATLIFDTGAEFTTITKSSADRFGLALQRTNLNGIGIGGITQIYAFMADSFQIGSLRGTHLPLFVTDFGVLHRTRADGVLGADFLAGYDVDLDFVHDRARLLREQGVCGKPALPLAGPIFATPLIPSTVKTDLRPFVSVRIKGQDFRAQVDTGSPTSLLFGNGARKLGLTAAMLAGGRRSPILGSGPEHRSAVQYVMPPVRLGGLTLTDLPVLVADQSEDDADMLLGLDFLTRVHVVLSHSLGLMLMQIPPGRASPAKS